MKVCLQLVFIVIILKEVQCLTCPSYKTTPTTKVTTQKSSAATKTTTPVTRKTTTGKPAILKTTSTQNPTSSQHKTQRLSNVSTTKTTAKPTNKQTTRHTTLTTTPKLTTRLTTTPPVTTTTKQTTRPTHTPKPTTKPTTKSTTKTTTRQTNSPTTKRTTQQATTTPTRKATTKPTIKTTRPTTATTTKQTTAKPSPKPTTKPTTKLTTKATTRQTNSPTTKRTTQKATTTSTRKATTKPTIQTTRPTTATTTKQTTAKPTPKPTTKPTTKLTTKATTRQTNSQTSKRTTQKATTTSIRKTTTKPTIKSTTRPTTATTTKQTTAKPTPKPTTKVTYKLTTKTITKITTHSTTKKTTQKSTPKPTIKSTTKRTTKAASRPTTRPTKLTQTPIPTSKAVTKQTQRPTTSTKPTSTPTTKQNTKSTPTKPSTKATTRPTNKPTTKSTLKPSTKPTTKATKSTKKATSRLTTRPKTQPATKQSTPKPTTTSTLTTKLTTKPTTKVATKMTNNPTTKTTTLKPTMKAIFNQTTKTTKILTTVPTTKKTTMKTRPTPTIIATTNPTTKSRTRITTSRKTNQITQKPTSGVTTKTTTKVTTSRTTKPNAHSSAPKLTTKTTSKPTTKAATKLATSPTRRSTSHIPAIVSSVKPTTNGGTAVNSNAHVADAPNDNIEITWNENAPVEDSPNAGTPPPFPSVSDNYQVEVEANIIDKGYTVDAKLYYDFVGNRAALSLSNKDNYEGWTKYIYSYKTGEIFTITSGSDTECTVQNLTSSRDIYSRWLFGYTSSADSGLHINSPTWKISFQDETDYDSVYLGNGSVRGIAVDHWQGCGKWDNNSSMMVDYYFAKSWNTAWTSPRVPLRIEIIADKQLPNGSINNLHHIYDFFNYQPFLDNDPGVFETPSGVICPGRKNTRPAPLLPQNFYYRVEIINADEQLVTYEDIWYDSYSSHYRKDYRPLWSQYPTYTTHPVTEIHDYFIGARYIIDKTLGNCSILPLTNESGEVLPQINFESAENPYFLSLKNPLQLFDMNSNFTYIGQSWQRGILCDVYVTERQTLLIAGFSATITVDITVYFLAREWLDYVNLGPDYSYQTPVKMELKADEIGFTAVYNYLDFTADRPFLDVYDITPCFSEKDEIRFRVKFPGTYQQGTGPNLKDIAHIEFANDMKVNILRVQGIELEYDDQYLYFSATLLDKPPPPALFEYVPGKVVEKEDDSVVFNVSVPMECPAYCINNKAFICNSYDFCSIPVGSLFQYECRLSKAHSSDGITLSNSQTCDHFTRSVNGLPPEPNIMEAYRNLRESVYNRTVNLMMANPNPGGFGIDPYMSVYTATDISVTFGSLTSKPKLPKFGDYFHYRIEVSVPATKFSYEAEIWYDKTLALIREDVHVNINAAPYYSTNPLTILEDFSTGLQYRIDRHSENCTIGAIPASSYYGIQTSTDPYIVNSTWSLRIRTGNELLFIDDSYNFIGQQTVRGMLCNVFESKRTDFKFPGVEGNYETLWRYFFLEDDWYEVSEESDIDTSVPVRLEITVTQLGVFMEYNFFDFDTDRPDVSMYDLHQCYNISDQSTFQIIFPGPYHPFLDTRADMFRLEAVFSLSRITGYEPIKFQRTRLDWDDENIYITTTMVGKTRQTIDYFTSVSDGGIPDTPDAAFDSYSTDSVDSCARACYSANFICNSFYYCTGTAKQCLLSKANVPNGPDIHQDPSCQAYSRTVTAKNLPPPDPDKALALIKNNVYRGNLWIEMFDEIGHGALQPHRYTATFLRTDIIGTIHAGEGTALSRFVVTGNNTKTTIFDSFLDNLSVDSCAMVCLDAKVYHCQGFSYCDNQLGCWLLKPRPENLSSNQTVKQSSCYIYQRNYLEEYSQSPGTVSMTVADFTYWPRHSVEECAKDCSHGQDFFKCRSFQYCPSTNECFIFRGRTINFPRYSESQPKCSYFTRNYLIDFVPGNTTGNYIITSDVEFLQVSAEQCAQLCVQQQSGGCHGFYFCDAQMTCHLMWPQSRAIMAFAGDSSTSQDISCTFYYRTDLQTTVPPTTTTSTTTSSSTQSTSTSSTTKTTTKPSSTSKTTTPTPTTSTVQTFRPPFTHTVWWPTPSTSSSSSQGSTTLILPTALRQTGGYDKNNNNNAGTVVGVAFATFILGLIIGAVSFYMFNKHSVFHNAYNYFNGRRKLQNHLNDKDERSIEMDFTKLNET